MRKLTDLGFHCRQIHSGMSLQKRIDAERILRKAVLWHKK
jgi:hypothetical protein